MTWHPDIPLDYRNAIVCSRAEDALGRLPADCIDLTVTSPPYDQLRAYHGFTFDFDTIARELYRVTKPGGVVVWVVGDETKDGSESGASFRQALGFMAIGFKLHDTMIYEKNNFVPLTHNRYEQAFEYMFVFSKGRPRVFNPFRRKTKSFGFSRNRNAAKQFEASYAERKRDEVTACKEDAILPNIFTYSVGANDHTEHNAPFPEKLAEDHILSWSNAGDVVLDPMCGSGTTCKMAIKHHRGFIGFDISQEYVDLARRRIGAVQPVMFDMVTLEAR